MKKYDVEDRRPIKEIFRKMAYWATDLCVAAGIKANTVSYASVVAAVVASILLWQSPNAPWLLLLAPWFAMLRLYFNMLDGMVALKSGEASSLGEVVNELPDRLSDVIIFAGVAHTVYAATTLTYWVMLGMLLVAYIGILGKAVGARRQFGGLMPKPVRMYLLVLGCYIQFFFARDPGEPVLFLGLTAIDVASIVILAGLAETAVQRTVMIFATLSRRG